MWLESFSCIFFHSTLRWKWTLSACFWRGGVLSYKVYLLAEFSSHSPLDWLLRTTRRSAIPFILIGPFVAISVIPWYMLGHHPNPGGYVLITWGIVSLGLAEVEQGLL